jgi:hypothetical protein
VGKFEATHSGAGRMDQTAFFAGVLVRAYNYSTVSAGGITTAAVVFASVLGRCVGGSIYVRVRGALSRCVRGRVTGRVTRPHRRVTPPTLFSLAYT